MEFISSIINIFPEYKETKFTTFIEIENIDKKYINDIKKHFEKCFLIQSKISDYIDLNREYKDVFTFLKKDLIIDFINQNENIIVKINDDLSLLKNIYSSLKNKSIIILDENIKLSNEQICHFFQKYNHILKIHNHIVVYV